MGAAKHIKMALADKDIKSGDLAELIGYGDRKQTFYNKLSRDKMSFEDVEEVARAIGCEVVLLDKETGKTY